MDFSFQQNKKYTECGDPDPDRDPQFKYIASESARFLGNGLPAISVNAKKKVGNFENDGAEYRSKDKPRLVNDHDFCDKKPLSYGIYNVGRNEGFVNIGVALTPASIPWKVSSWRFLMGRCTYPDAKEV